MADVLFVTWDGGGNVPPALGIADELRRRGHRTRFLGHAGQEPTLAGAGHGFRAYTRAQPFVGSRPASLPRLVRLFSDRGMGYDLVDEARRRPADLVVVDALLLGALDAAAAHGLRHVTLQHLFDAYQRGGWLKGPVGAWARLRGLRPLQRWRSAELAISATLPELDPGRAGASANVRFTGPVLTTPRRPAAFDDPMVLVSLSTFHYPGMRAVLQRVVDATEGLEARVVVTTGPVIDPDEVRAHPRAEVHRFVPHDELMPAASVVVGHGGHGTAMRSLAHDLPLLVVPMHPLLDHPMVGRAVQGAGAGSVVKKSASVAVLRRAMEELAAPGPHRAAAARLGAQIRRADGARTAANLLEELLRREPARSPTAA
jgi:UDP:flavonoid glycosyltransferase YjiC (YdhE family)